MWSSTLETMSKIIDKHRERERGCAVTSDLISTCSCPQLIIVCWGSGTPIATPLQPLNKWLPSVIQAGSSKCQSLFRFHGFLSLLQNTWKLAKLKKETATDQKDNTYMFQTWEDWVQIKRFTWSLVNVFMHIAQVETMDRNFQRKTRSAHNKKNHAFFFHGNNNYNEEASLTYPLQSICLDREEKTQEQDKQSRTKEAKDLKPLEKAKIGTAAHQRAG